MMAHLSEACLGGGYRPDQAASLTSVEKGPGQALVLQGGFSDLAPPCIPPDVGVLESLYVRGCLFVHMDVHTLLGSCRVRLPT